MNPLKLIALSQTAAKDASDGNGRFCQLATVDEYGDPRVRTVIMHDVTETHIGCVYSEYHNKAQHLAANGRFQVYVWHPTQGNQFMVNGTYSLMPRERLQLYWDDFLSVRSKQLDLFYTTNGDRRPAAPYASREVLENDYWAHVKNLEETQDPLDMPDHVIGGHFIADRVEHLHVSGGDGRFHHRSLYTLKDGEWGAQVLVP